ncbi:1-deoxy-D-xylulose-5-phosphate synthase [Varanus komodoensis]|nr:1-deoxy-D-xylulose-5-phosphate synthase [Varanus komodoensis]
MLDQMQDPLVPPAVHMAATQLPVGNLQLPRLLAITPSCHSKSHCLIRCYVKKWFPVICPESPIIQLHGISSGSSIVKEGENSIISLFRCREQNCAQYSRWFMLSLHIFTITLFSTLTEWGFQPQPTCNIITVHQTEMGYFKHLGVDSQAKSSNWSLQKCSKDYGLKRYGGNDNCLLIFVLEPELVGTFCYVVGWVYGTSPELWGKCRECQSKAELRAGKKALDGGCALESALSLPAFFPPSATFAKTAFSPLGLPLKDFGAHVFPRPETKIGLDLARVPGSVNTRAQDFKANQPSLYLYLNI